MKEMTREKLLYFYFPKILPNSALMPDEFSGIGPFLWDLQKLSGENLARVGHHDQTVLATEEQFPLRGHEKWASDNYGVLQKFLHF